MSNTLNRHPLSNTELASFCSQMSMILRSGISALEGITIMAEYADTKEGAAILKDIQEQMELTGSFHTALADSRVFPQYALDMVLIGENTGNLDQVMAGLAAYYEREEQIRQEIRGAVTYPLAMIAMMLVVILVLIVKVLPIFNQVFIQLGSEMTGFSRSVLHFGQLLNNYALLFLAVSAILLAALVYGVRTRKLFALLPYFQKLTYKLALSRFTGGMAMALASGLDMDMSLSMTAKLVEDTELHKKIKACQQEMESGIRFSEALVKASIFSGIQARLLSVGSQTGSMDVVMKKLADELEDEVNTRIQHLISILEPTLVAILSIFVGMILLSVMLPLMGVMSSISVF